MSREKIAAVVPVKGFAAAKQRLCSVLSQREREQLARVMLEDVVTVLRQSESLSAVYIVTDDVTVARLGRSLGAGIIIDPIARGLSEALAHAAQTLSAWGYEGMMIVPADIPGIDVNGVEYLLSVHAPSPAVTLVAAPSDGGTNVLLCSPPDVIPNCFGLQSFAAHCSVAESKGITPNAIVLPGVQCDIDRPSDLLTFLASPTQTKTYHYLRGKRIAQRLSPPPAVDRLMAPGYMTASVPLSATSSLQKG